MLVEAGAAVGPDKDVEVVFHLAAQTSARDADEDPLEDLSANVEPMYGLIEEFRGHEPKPFIVFAGAATQVGVPAESCIHEGMTDAPLTVYDLHKCMAEMALEHACRRGWARGCTLRLANVYGQSTSESGPTRGVLNRMIRQSTRGEPVQVYGAGDWTRDYVYLDDVCRAFMLAAANQATTNGRHFVVGSGAAHLFARVAAIAAGGNFKHVTPDTVLAAIDTRNAVMDTSAFRHATGWRPAVWITEGIELTRAHYTEHP
jgi:nucleoside-diphosphate-sugar epimerase